MDAFSLLPPDEQPFGPPCPGCGRARTAADAAGLAWSSRHITHDAEVVVEHFCPACTRAEIAQIETGLPISRASSAA